MNEDREREEMPLTKSVARRDNVKGRRRKALTNDVNVSLMLVDWELSMLKSDTKCH